MGLHIHTGNTELSTPIVKTCKKCRQTKVLQEFHRQASQADGHRPACKVCVRSQNNEWYAANRDRHMESCRARWAADPETHRARVRQSYSRRDRDAYNRKKREWARAARDLVYAKEVRRHSRQFNAPGYSTADDIAARWEMWGGQCWMCGRVATETDHVIPISRGGSNWPANLRPACKPCNSRKGTRSWKDMRS